MSSPFLVYFFVSLFILIFFFFLIFSLKFFSFLFAVFPSFFFFIFSHFQSLEIDNKLSVDGSRVKPLLFININYILKVIQKSIYMKYATKNEYILKWKKYVYNLQSYLPMITWFFKKPIVTSVFTLNILIEWDKQIYY